MELRHLRAFLHVAELKSISAAAQRLGLAQPALSRHIRLLEEEFGVRLLQRHGRGVILNDQGKILMERATRILRELDEAREELRGASSGLDGEVSIGLTPTVSAMLSTSIVEKLKSEHPNLRPRVVSGYSAHIFDWLQRGKIDVAVLYDDGQAERTMIRRPIVKERLYFADASGKGSKNAPIPMAEIAKRPLIMAGRQDGLRRLVERIAEANGLELNVVVEAEHLPVQIGLVHRGIGGTIVHSISVRNDVGTGLLNVRPIENPTITRELVLCVRREQPFTKFTKWFGGILDGLIAHEVSAGRWTGTLTEATAH